MNELYAVEPTLIRSSSELFHLLRNFGPYVGQYLALYPRNWIKSVEERFRLLRDTEQIDDIEFKNVSELLIEAKRKNLVVERVPEVRYDYANGSWLENAVRHLATDPPAFAGIVATGATPPSWDRLDRFAPPKSAGEEFHTKASEYGRICKPLIYMSREFALVDPFLNPLNKKYADVLKVLFSLAASFGKCQKIILWTDAKNILGSYNFNDSRAKDVKTRLLSSLRELAKSSALASCDLEINFVNDCDATDDFHARCIISIEGVIKFDHGFPILSFGKKKNDASPLGEKLHNRGVEKYFEGKHDMKVDPNPIRLSV